MTPLIKVDNYYLKREDYNPTGSAKDRAISHQVSQLVKQGITNAVISSSGNAAISAAHFCQQANINLTIFVPENINPQKAELIKAKQVYFSKRPISDAFRFAKSHHAHYLRQSTDPNAQTGYQSIGRELLEQLPQISSLFIPVGSGTTLLGISQAIPQVKIFAVQPASYPPIASQFDHDYTREELTITDSLSVRLLPLKTKVLQASFSGLVVQNSEAIFSQTILFSNSITTSPEGALAHAGFLKAQKMLMDIGNYPVILLTGAKR